MKNPVPQSKLFVTPKDEQALFDMLEQYTGESKALAFQVAMMTFNLCNQLVAEELQKDLTV